MNYPNSEPARKAPVTNPTPPLVTFASPHAIPARDRPLTAIKVRRHDSGGEMSFTGRAAWALGQLVAAGAEGITSLSNPAPRLAHYCYLIRKAGLDVETVHETHLGPYSGHHGRYLLRTPLHVLSIEEV